MTDKALTVRSNESSLPAMAGNPIANALDAAEKLGRWIAGSNMFACKTIEAGQVMALTCLTEGITPLQFARTYDVIQTERGTQVCYKAQAMLAKLVSLGGDYEILESTDKKCRIKFSWMRNGKPKTAEYAYTIEDAKQAGLVKPKGAYETRPKTMLFNRCASNGLRLHISEYFSGYYLAEELLDTPPSPHQGPTPGPQPLPNQPATLEAQFTESVATTTVTESAGTFDPPSEAPETFDAPDKPDKPDTAEPESDRPFADYLQSKGLNLAHVVCFLRDVTRWVTPASMEHVPAWAVVEGLLPDQKERIRKGIDAFADKVDQHAFANDLPKDEEDGAAGQPEGPAEQDDPPAEPEDGKTFPNEIHPTKKRRGRKKKDEGEEGGKE